MNRLTQLENWVRPLYARYEKMLPPLFFVGGFTWDSLTLRRIDQWFDNLILFCYLILLGVMIVVVVLTEQRQIQRPFLLKYSQWYPLIIQFLLGGLFSAYVVFYFKSASSINTYVFLSILILLLIANEFLQKRFTKVKLLLPLYFLTCFSFFIFFIPIATKTVNVYTFLAAGLISVLILGGMLTFFYLRAVFSSRSQFLWVGGVVGTLYLLMHLFYLQNWIPPVPLSMTEGGVYHSITTAPSTNGDKHYVLKYERPRWYQFWKTSNNPYRYAEGDTVFCFVSIFAPTRLEKNVYHQWAHYDPQQKTWTETDRIPYRQPIEGARDLGYRGYTFKRVITPGRWRVDVKTDDGLTVGRVKFDVVPDTHGVTNFLTRYR